MFNTRTHWTSIGRGGTERPKKIWVKSNPSDGRK
jgi:hypothetical protein